MKNNAFARRIGKINWYPPFLGMGIRVVSVADDATRFDVELRQKWYTRNLFGTHFGGALYTMCDPFYVFIVTLNLGRDFIVWDKSAAIDFLKPARGTIRGVFEISPDRLATIRAEVDERGKQTFHFSTELIDENGQARRTRRQGGLRARETAQLTPFRQHGQCRCHRPDSHQHRDSANCTAGSQQQSGDNRPERCYD